MKRLIFSGLLMLAASVTYGDQQRTQLKPSCGNITNVAQLMDEYNETTVFYGTKTVVDPRLGAVEVTVLITANTKTGSWSQFEIFNKNMACITAGGIGGTVPNPEKI